MSQSAGTIVRRRIGVLRQAPDGTLVRSQGWVETTVGQLRAQAELAKRRGENDKSVGLRRT